MSPLLSATFDAAIPLVIGATAVYLGYRPHVAPGDARSRMLRKVMRVTGPVILLFSAAMISLAVLHPVAAPAADAPVVDPSRGGVVNALTGEADARLIARTMKQTAKLPAIVDDTTRLDDIGASSPRELVWTFTITPRSEGDLTPILEQLKASIHQNACGNANATKLLKLGIDLDHVYRDGAGRELLRVRVTPADCKP